MDSPARRPRNVGLIVVIAVAMFFVGMISLVVSISIALVQRDTAPALASGVPTEVVVPSSPAVEPVAVPVSVADDQERFPTIAPPASTAMHTLIDGSEISLAVMTGSTDVAYRIWTIALFTYDAPTALVLYRPTDAGDPEAAVEQYITQMHTLFPGPGDREGPMGDFRDVREAGEYTDPAEPGVRYAVTQIFFEKGVACLRGALVNEGGWHVRSWGQLSAAECEVALSAIADNQ